MFCHNRIRERAPSAARPLIESLESRQFLSTTVLPHFQLRVKARPYVPAPSPVSQPPDPLSPAGPSLPGNWQLNFYDEFNGDSLDPIWRPVEYFSNTHTSEAGEAEAYDSTGVSVSNGALQLTAQKEKKYGRSYVSGLVQTGGQTNQRNSPVFSFLYGYIEVRAKIPFGKGLWPAIWMLPASHHDGNGEIDIMENLAGDPTTSYLTVHRHGTHQQHVFSSDLNLSADYHTYAVDWEPDHITWYLDGNAVATTTRTSLIPTEPMYPILDLAVGGWAGKPNASTDFPSSMSVDYVRVWQQS